MGNCCRKGGKKIDLIHSRFANSPDRANVRFVRPNIQIYDARVIDLYR
jgi:hypothetical protein